MTLRRRRRGKNNWCLKSKKQRMLFFMRMSHLIGRYRSRKTARADNYLSPLSFLFSSFFTFLTHFLSKRTFLKYELQIYSLCFDHSCHLVVGHCLEPSDVSANIRPNGWHTHSLFLVRALLLIPNGELEILALLHGKAT